MMPKLSWEETIRNNHTKSIHKTFLCSLGIPHNRNISNNIKMTLISAERLHHLDQKPLSQRRVEGQPTDIWSTTVLCLLSFCEIFHMPRLLPEMSSRT